MDQRLEKTVKMRYHEISNSAGERSRAMRYVTSDLHGYPLPDFLRLLEKARFSDSDELIVLGDVIDRNGDGGVSLLCWMLRQANVRLILGNHEDMLLSCRFLFDAVTDESPAHIDRKRIRFMYNWMMNGAEPTLEAMRALFQKDGDTARDILKMLEDAPLYDTVDLPGRKYVLTHSGLGGFRADKPLKDYSPDDLLWTRPRITDAYYQDKITVFGHTPTGYYGPEHAGKMVKTPTWIDIDTGAAHGGHPMLLRLDDETPFYADAR